MDSSLKSSKHIYIRLSTSVAIVYAFEYNKYYYELHLHHERKDGKLACLIDATVSKGFNSELSKSIMSGQSRIYYNFEPTEQQVAALKMIIVEMRMVGLKLGDCISIGSDYVAMHYAADELMGKLHSLALLA